VTTARILVVSLAGVDIVRATVSSASEDYHIRRYKELYSSVKGASIRVEDVKQEE